MQPLSPLQLVSSLASIILTLVAYWPYVHAIRAGAVKPHFYSWLIWSLTTSIVFLAQLAAAGGAGAWPTGVSAVITLYVTWVAWRLKGDISITPLDKGFLVAALASLPVWGLTADPLWSVVILTTVDTLGFGPTLRKLWRHPFEESATFFSLFAARSALSIHALESRTLTTVLFPGVMVLASVLVAVLVLWRRRVIAS